MLSDLSKITQLQLGVETKAPHDCLQQAWSKVTPSDFEGTVLRGNTAPVWVTEHLLGSQPLAIRKVRLRGETVRRGPRARGHPPTLSPKPHRGPGWQPHSGSRSLNPRQKPPQLYVPWERDEPPTLTWPQWLICGPNK